LAQGPAIGKLDEISDGRVLLAGEIDDTVENGAQARDALQLVVVELLVHAFRVEVEVQGFRKQRQSIDRLREFVDDGHLILGHGLRLAGDRIYRRCYADLTGIAAALRDQLLEGRVVLLADLDIGIDAKDKLSPACREDLPAARLSRLDDDGAALL